MKQLPAGPAGDNGTLKIARRRRACKGKRYRGLADSRSSAPAVRSSVHRRARLCRVPPGGRYARLLALAGTMRSDHTDVSGDKYKHLAEIYADNHETRR